MDFPNLPAARKNERQNGVKNGQKWRHLLAHKYFATHDRTCISPNHDVRLLATPGRHPWLLAQRFGSEREVDAVTTSRLKK